MTEEELRDLERAFRESEGRLGELEDEASRQVTLWVWSTFDPGRRSPFLFARELSHESPGRAIPEPARHAEVDLFGYGSGALVLARSYGVEGRYDLTVLRPDGRCTWQFEGNDREGLARVGVIERSSGHPVRAATYRCNAVTGRWRWEEETYTWADGRVIEFVQRSDEVGLPAAERERARNGRRSRLHYDELGLLRIESEWPSGEPMVLYRRRDPVVSVRGLSRALGSALALGVPLALSALEEDIGLACLVYGPLPPTLHVLGRVEADALFADPAFDATALNPAEWGAEAEVPIPFDLVGYDADAAAQHIRELDAEDEMRRVVQATATRLAKDLGASGVGVYACDVAATQLEDDLHRRSTAC